MSFGEKDDHRIDVQASHQHALVHCQRLIHGKHLQMRSFEYGRQSCLELIKLFSQNAVDVSQSCESALSWRDLVSLHSLGGSYTHDGDQPGTSATNASKEQPCLVRC